MIVESCSLSCLFEKGKALIARLTCHHHHLPSSMPPFPLFPELLDLAFQHIGDYADLGSCRLVSRAFCAAASRSFYKTFSITLHCPGPAYTIARCKAMNELLNSKPHILDYIRTLRICLSMFATPWQDTGDPDEDSTPCVDFPEMTKLLLTMTHAVGLEELTIGAGIGTGWIEARSAGKDNMLALLALRCMPSLRRVHLEYIDSPPIALLIGIPGEDSVLEMAVSYGKLDIGKMEADWQDLGLPTEGPLAHPFKEAKADWETILRVTSQLHTFSSTETPPLHQLEDLDVKDIDRFHALLVYVQEKMGGRQPLFPRLGIFRYHPFRPSDTSAGETTEWVGRMLAMDYTSIRKIIIIIQPTDCHGESDSYCLCY